MNSPTQKEMIDLTEQLVSDMSSLLKVYLIKMGIPMAPVFTIKPVTSWDKLLTFEEVLEAIDQSLAGKRSSYPQGVRTKSRRRELVIIRQIACVIGKELGYTHTEIGEKLAGMNHSTVTHACKMVNDLIESGDNDTIRLNTQIRLIVDAHQKNKYGEGISNSKQSRDNS